MASAEGISCQICLNADEPQDVLDVEILHHHVLRDARVSICRFCAEAILSAVVRSGKELPLEEALADARFAETARRLRDSVRAAAAVHQEDAGNQPGNSRARGDRHEPEEAAGGGGLRSAEEAVGVEGEVMEKPVEDGK